MTRGRKGAPSLDDLRLWRQVTRSVLPLGREPPSEEPDGEPAERASQPSPRPVIEATRPSATPPARSPALAPIDRRTANRLTRGTVTIDARVDLHGLTQAAAHGRLLRFLAEAQENGARMTLVVTGKGRPPDETAATGSERGVLRRVVPMWLASAEMRPFVVGFGEAGPTHGGAGALYVRVRRVKRPVR